VEAVSRAAAGRSEPELDPDFFAATGSERVQLPWLLDDDSEVWAPTCGATEAAREVPARPGTEAPVAGGASVAGLVLEDGSFPADLSPATGLGLRSAGAVATGCTGWDWTESVAAVGLTSAAAG